MNIDYKQVMERLWKHALAGEMWAIKLIWERKP